MTYANGEIPASALVQATNGAPGQLLEPQTEKQWAWMVSDAAKAGIRLAPEPDDGIPSCYRSLAAQQVAYNELGYPRASTPGYSNHGLGTAIDIALSSSITYWLQAHAEAHGFVFDVPNEPWHAHRTKTLTVPGSSSSSSSSSSSLLKVGSKGTAVTALQRGMNRVFPAYSKLTIDGVFGPATKAVVVEFQRRVGIAQDGIVGPVTRAKLASYGVTL